MSEPSATAAGAVTGPSYDNRDAHGRFGPGNAGRPPGARNRASQRAALAILQDFQAHQADYLYKLRQYNAPLYVALLTRVLPRPPEGDLFDLEDYSEIEVADVVEGASSARERIQRGEASLAELEEALLMATASARAFAP